MRVDLRRQHAQLRTTTVYVTHDQTEAMTLADRIVVLNAGIVQQVGTPQELYDKPANRFVAGFIGSPGMNFLARLEDAIIGVRPHDVVIGEGPRTATVEVVERLGFESLVHLRLGEEVLVARVEGAPPRGDVRVSFTRSVRFDRLTGERV